MGRDQPPPRNLLRLGQGRPDLPGRGCQLRPTGGSDFNGDTCPQLVGIAIGELETYRDKGTRRETIGDGDFVTLTCGQAQLAKKVTAAAPTAGDIIRIVYDSDYKTGKGTGKGFTVKVKRGQPRAQAAPPPNSRSDLF
jgi:hypothetical protein